MAKAPHGRREVGVRDLRDHLSAWLERVQEGDELVITERGRPVARMVSASREPWLGLLVEAGVVTLPDRRLDVSSFGRVRTKGDLMEFVFEQRR
jgi:prevent-host-death family protein